MAAQHPRSGSTLSAPMAALDKATLRAHHLLKFLNMNDAEWALLAEDDKKKKWWNVLDIAQPRAVSGNVASKLSTLRSVFTSPFISRTGTLWLKHLLAGNVQCVACSHKSLKKGVVECSVAKVGRQLTGQQGWSRQRSACLAWRHPRFLT